MTWRTFPPAPRTAGRAPISTRSGLARTPCADCGRTGTRACSTHSDSAHRDPAQRDPAPGSRSADRDRTADGRSVAGARFPADRAPDGAQAVRHVDEPVAAAGLLLVEPRAIVGDREQQPARVQPQPHLRARAGGMLGSVLQCLKAAEVNGRLYLRGVPGDVVG